MHWAHAVRVPNPKESVYNGSCSQTSQDLMQELQDDDDVTLLPNYVEYCRRTLFVCGDTLYSKLATRGHYLAWAHLEKIGKDNKDIYTFKTLDLCVKLWGRAGKLSCLGLVWWRLENNLKAILGGALLLIV